eukprot:3724658-Pyramimonas_sp.AAC.1
MQGSTWTGRPLSFLSRSPTTNAQFLFHARGRVGSSKQCGLPAGDQPGPPDGLGAVVFVGFRREADLPQLDRGRAR